MSIITTDVLRLLQLHEQLNGYQTSVSNCLDERTQSTAMMILRSCEKGCVAVEIGI